MILLAHVTQDVFLVLRPVGAIGVGAIVDDTGGPDDDLVVRSKL